MPSPPTLDDRASGVLLHATSLPGPHGSGDLGSEARAFADSLARAGQRWWQMLPVGPAGYGDSPYSSLSAFAGNPLLVDLDALGIPVDHATFDDNAVDFARVTPFRETHLRRAYEAFVAKPTDSPERRAFDAFAKKEAAWLDDYALFEALKRAHGGVEWTKWEAGVRLRKPEALARAREEHADVIARVKVAQFFFAEQWVALRSYCNARGIALMGDLPIFVAHDSADVWQNRELFDLDEQGMPHHVAGVPPDYFSATGQRWGNPLYLWGDMAKTGFAWWVERFRAALARFDVIRIDHFIGFVRYWEIPASDPTAVNGTWKPGPGHALFDRVAKELGALPLVAEDLGVVTEAVTKLRDDLQLPGIRLIQFAFGTDAQAPTFLPHAHERRSVVYTGTHDNDTICGWFFDRCTGADSTRTADQGEIERQKALAYLGRTGEDPATLAMNWEMIRLAMGSVARTAILPMQDILGLGSESRMNRPGQAGGNWRWRLAPGAFDRAVEEHLLAVTQTYGRTQ